MSCSEKILVVGGSRKGIAPFLSKITGIHAKNGPFSMVLVAGDLFSDLDTEKDVEQLLNGDIKVPVPIYVISGRHSLPPTVAAAVEARGGDICENLTYLGKQGVFTTTSGMCLAFVSGTFDGNYFYNGYNMHNDHPLEGSAGDRLVRDTPFYSQAEIQSLRSFTLANPSSTSISNMPSFTSTTTTSSSSSSKKATKIDILVTYDWPESIISGSAVWKQETPSPLLSRPIADVAAACKPRYHFAAGGGSSGGFDSPPIFFEREPFSIPGSAHVCRFVGLGDFGASNKERWFYAFAAEPISRMDEAKLALLNVRPPSTTISPLILGSDIVNGRNNASKRPLEEDAPASFFWGDASNGSKKPRRGEPGERRPPPPHYTCHKCNEKGHWIQDCPLHAEENKDNTNGAAPRSKQPPPESYTCNKCNEKGHWVKDCPLHESTDVGGAHGGRKPPPDHYICVKCNTKGHWIQDCPLHETEGGVGGGVKKTKPPPDHYTCNICNEKGHWIKECPQKTQTQPRIDLARDPNQCWFCLSNPSIEQHLIITLGEELYLTMAKGPITEDGHMIAIPITHYISRRHLMDLQGDEQKSAQTYLAELEKFKKGIEATFAKEGMMLLAYEVFAGWIGGNGDGNSPAAVDRQDWERRQHMITQLVAIPNELLPMIESMFREAADREQFDVSEDGSLPEDINTPYFHLDVPVLEGDDGESSKTTSVPRRKRLVFVPNDERTSRAFEEYADQKMQHQSRRRNPGAAGWMNLRFGSQVVAELLGRPDRADWKKWVKEKDEETAITKTWQKKLKPVLQ